MDAHCTPSGDTRTLHALELPARLCDTGDARLRRGLYVDCETTGFSFEHDQVIELALLPFTYAVDDGRIAEVLPPRGPGPSPGPRPCARAQHRHSDRTDRRGLARVQRRRRRSQRAHCALRPHRRAQRAVRPSVLRAGPAGDARRALGLLVARGALDSPRLPERRGALPCVPIRRIRPRPTPRARRLRGRRVAARASPPRLRAARTGGAA